MDWSTASVKRRNQVPPGFWVEDAFGEVLRQIRNTRKLSQEALARQTGFDRTFIGMLERGLVSPSLRTLFRLAESLASLRQKSFDAWNDRSPLVLFRLVRPEGRPRLKLLFTPGWEFILWGLAQ
jgi:transcriptional regulator with XRE-family HTH domain